MKTIDEVLTLYFHAWNEPSLTEALVAESCAKAIHYVDPRYVCRSAGELAARIQRSRAEYPSSRVRFTSAVDGYETGSRRQRRATTGTGGANDSCNDALQALTRIQSELVPRLWSDSVLVATAIRD